MPVPVLVMVSLALATTAPLGSVMLPAMTPFTDWERAPGGSRLHRHTNRRDTKLFLSITDVLHARSKKGLQVSDSQPDVSMGARRFSFALLFYGPMVRQQPFKR